MSPSMKGKVVIITGIGPGMGRKLGVLVAQLPPESAV